MKPKDVASYIFLAVVWGFSFLVLLRVVQAFGWIGAVTLRAFVAAGTLFIAARLTRRKLDFAAGWFPLAVVGATTVAGQLIGLSFATPLIGTAMAAILVATIPLFATAIGRLWGIERVTPARLMGLLLGLAGIVMLVGFPAVTPGKDFALGCGAALFACLSAAFGTNYASARLRGVGAWETTIGSFLAGGIMTLPLLVLVPVPAWPRLQDYAYLLVLGGIMSATTYAIYFRLVATIGPATAISVEFAVTAVAVVVGAFWLREPLSLTQIGGGVLIVCGCALVLGLIPGGRGPGQPHPPAVAGSGA